MECKFKVGDKVKKFKGSWAPYVGVVDRITPNLTDLPYISGTVIDPLTGGKTKGVSFGAEEDDFMLYQESSETTTIIDTAPKTFSLTFDKENKETQKHKCRCDFRDLMMKGCVCNGI
jgi:hypothetical protein